MRLTLQELQQAFPSWEFRNVSGSEKKEIFIDAMVHDSRVVDPKKHELFIIAEGPTFDPHDFIDDALNRGAVAAMCEKEKIAKVTVKKPLILVESARDALAELTRYVRGKIEVPVIGITGSTGKSTTRALLSSILGVRSKVLSADIGTNINTLWGNLELVASVASEDYVVLEISMDHPGEIRWQCDALHPDLGCIINIGEVHAGPLGGVKEVVKEKKQMALSLHERGKPVVLNIDDVNIRSFLSELTGEMITVSAGGDADFWAKDIQIGRNGLTCTIGKGMRAAREKVSVQCKVFGHGYVYDILCASALAGQFGCSLDDTAEGLRRFSGFSYRFERVVLSKYVTVINDAYNANSQSMPMSIDTFWELWGTDRSKKIAILGDMKELGEASEKAHRKLGDQLRNRPFDEVYYVGEFHDIVRAGTHLADRDEAKQVLSDIVQKRTNGKERTVVLLKASNGVGLYTIPAEIQGQ